MPATNLAKVFGPTLLGYSVPDPGPNIVIEETRTQQKVVELLLEISNDYWGTFVTVPEESAENRFASPEKRMNSGSRRRSLLSFTPLQQRYLLLLLLMWKEWVQVFRRRGYIVVNV